MKLYLIHHPHTDETQPIDLENIFSISIVKSEINPNMSSLGVGNYIWSHGFYICPKIGQAILIAISMKEYKKSLTRKERWVASWRWDPDIVKTIVKNA